MGEVAVTMGIVRVPQAKGLYFTLVERQVVAAFLWDKKLHRVEEYANRKEWRKLIDILTLRRLDALEEHDRLRRLAALMWGQGARIRSNGKVYPSDARKHLELAARKVKTQDHPEGLDPEGLRAAVHEGLLIREHNEPYDPYMALFRAIGLESGVEGNGGRYAPVPNGRTWPPVGRLVPFRRPSSGRVKTRREAVS